MASKGVEAAAPEGNRDSRRARFADLCEETVGVGEIEWRTFRDLLVRPRELLETYLVHGPTGGRRYARPLGFYMGMCGVLMFYIFLVGGMSFVAEAQPSGSLDKWIAQSGKTRAEFLDDLDSWMSLVVTPVIALFNTLFVAPLLKWWSGLDWRRSFRSTFVLMCAWTAPILFLGPAPMIDGLKLAGAIIMYGALFVAFLRMGRGLWFDRWAGGVAKCLLLFVVLIFASWAGTVPSYNIGIMGAIYGR